MENHLQPFGETGVSSDSQAIRHFREAIANGKHWYIALLKAVGQWTVAEENYDDRDYRYLIANEAFDWLLLAQRLLDEVDYMVPEEEMIDLLFHGKAPIELSKEEFCHLIGEAKYRAHLNYFYGVTVEEALILAVEEEAHKEQRACPFNENNHLLDEAYQRIYGASMTEMLRRFRKQMGYPKRKSMEFAEVKEFTYWLFKYRLNNSDKARIASDTKKGLNELGLQWSLGNQRRNSLREPA